MRIRSLKPEWLDDEKLATTSDAARVLSVGLILLADDYGRGRAHPAFLDSKVWPYSPDAERTDRAAKELVQSRFIDIYEVRGQHYYAIRNWTKHQKVDHPGRPQVPEPESCSAPDGDCPGSTYFIRGAMTGLIKIGTSTDPVKRLAYLARCGSEQLDLLAISGTPETEVHRKLAEDRVHGEWFRPSTAVLTQVREAGGDPAQPIASATYEDGKPILANPREPSRPSPLFLANPREGSRPAVTPLASPRDPPQVVSETLAPDLDLDQDQMKEEESEVLASPREDFRETTPTSPPTAPPSPTMSYTTPESDPGTDPRVPALASVLRQHRSLMAVIQSPEQYAEQHLLRLWGSHHTVENVSTAIGQAAADTPAGERPADTLRRIRTYVQAVETRRSKPMEACLPIQSALVRPEGGLRPGGPVTVKARGAGN